MRQQTGPVARRCRMPCPDLRPIATNARFLELRQGTPRRQCSVSHVPSMSSLHVTGTWRRISLCGFASSSAGVGKGRRAWRGLSNVIILLRLRRVFTEAQVGTGCGVDTQS